jgi:hypothetical protein
MRPPLKLTLALCLGGLTVQTSRAAMRVLVDHVGYEIASSKQALIMGTEEDHPERFELVDAGTNKAVFSGRVVSAGAVASWGDRVFWTADFSEWKDRGHYALVVSSAGGRVSSSVFDIDQDILERNTLSNVVFYFKSQRSSGLIDRADRHLALPGGERGFVDVHGGWYDATGDYGIHLSHQNPSSYFNPQQVPLVVWTLLKSYRVLLGRKDDNFSEYERRMLDEGLFGADFLVRMKRPNGSFFETITAPGKGKLPQDRSIGNPNWKTKLKTNSADTTENLKDAVGPHAFEAGFRSGGGMAIAALALASTMPVDGDFPRAIYLRTAEEAFDFLSQHNLELLNDGKENILDDYCALLAATELFRATHAEKYREAARQRAGSLMGRLTSTDAFHDFWRADDATRPYFHPSDAGLPVISLLEYNTIASVAEQKRIRDTVERSLRFELATTVEVNNPFGYARQLLRLGDGSVRTGFFFPHDTEAAPWWQGEDARLASLAGAARAAMPLFADDPAFHRELQNYAWHQLDWILGRNPFDTCMLIGTGHGNAPYMFFESYKYTSPPGGIVNGITASLASEDGIAWNEGFAVTGKDEDWRWTEGWLPHAAWFLYAVSLPHA